MAALKHGNGFHAVKWSFNNSIGSYGWRQDIARPTMDLLRGNQRYLETLTNLDLGVTKIKGWFKSQRQQAKDYRNDQGQTGASGAKTEKTAVELRQRLYSTNAAVNKDQVRQSKLPAAAPDDDGGEDDGEDLSWEDVGVRTIVDTRDGGANLSSRMDAEGDDYTSAGDGGDDVDFEWEEDEFEVDGGGGSGDAGGGDAGGGDEEDEEASATESEPVTDGGGTSRAGVSGGGRGAGGAASGGGGGRGTGGENRAGGGASSAPNASKSTNGGTGDKAKGKGPAPRHAKKGTHKDIDEEEAKQKTNSRAVPPGGKRQPSWPPPRQKKTARKGYSKESTR